LGGRRIGLASRIREFVVYAKVTAILLVVLAVGLIVFMNRSYRTRFWPGASEVEVSTLWLMLATSVTSIVLFWLLCRVRRVFGELGRVRQDRAERERAARQSRLKDELDAQEKRIDAKLKRGLEEGAGDET
jgi:heme/copper-type cytochrome/quinol oxidase subunit 2